MSLIKVFTILLSSAVFLGAQERPNIILMLSDNIGYGDFGCYGGGIIRAAPTPNIDKIADEGIRFTNFNVEAECTPSRSALMTGRYAVRSGTTRAIPIQGLPQGLAPWEITLAEVLKTVGYRTAIFGKWHLGKESGRYPTDQGFDEWWGLSNSTGNVMWLDKVGYDPKYTKKFDILQGTVTDGVVADVPYDMSMRPRMDSIIEYKSVNYIHQHKNDDEPFFLYIPWTAMHHPYAPNIDFKGKSQNGDYADMMIEHDYRVGQILQAVEDAGIAENTMIIYASDNGPDRVLFPTVGDTGPFRGYLGDVHEGAVRTPMMIKWDNHIEERSVTNEIVAISDIFTTIASIVGADIPNDRAIDGVDQSCLIFNTCKKGPREGMLYFHQETLMAAKWRQFKFYFRGEGVQQEQRTYSDLWLPQAYNIMQDPKEYADIILQNLWLLSPALSQLVPFYVSVRKYGLIQPGNAHPTSAEIEIPFVESSQLNAMFNNMMKKAKAESE